MLAKVLSLGLQAIEGYPVEIEVDIARGLPAVNIVGLPDSSVKESKERVKSAIKNSGFNWPPERITISLAPSGIRKEGSCFDLAIALGILSATEQINNSRLCDYYILGELSLDGSLKPVPGTLPMAISIANSNRNQIMLPVQNVKEAAIVKGVNAFGLKSLKECVEFLNDPAIVNPFRLDLKEVISAHSDYGVDFSEVKGQYLAKRAIEIAVSGSHNILMIGPPGSGKTMLAKRIPTIIPDLSLEEVLEVSKIHSAMGNLSNHNQIIATRPFRQLHHSASTAAMIGGGSIPAPGEISLAHQGVLFLDEFPEFRRDCLEALRQPLEEGVIRVSRIFKTIVFPASFMLVAAMNPCPCGYYTDPHKACRCNTTQISRYHSKISGPLLDRIDIQIEISPSHYQELSQNIPAESSAQIKERINMARAIQRDRFKNEGIFYNAGMSHKQVRKFCTLGEEENKLLKMAMSELNFSARAYDKILKLSRTIADLAQSEDICTEHIAESVQYRTLDRQWQI